MASSSPRSLASAFVSSVAVSSVALVLATGVLTVCSYHGLSGPLAEPPRVAAMPRAAMSHQPGKLSVAGADDLDPKAADAAMPGATAEGPRYASDTGGDGCGQQTPCRFERKIKVALQYLLYLPKDYDRNPSWPLVLFLHGAEDQGNDLRLVARRGPPRLIAAGQGFPCIVVSPQCPAERRWEPIELTALLDDIVQKYKVDQDRIYVTGLSMGGFGTWALAAHTPNRFAALVPICGGGDPLWAVHLAHVPVWAFHREKDPVVPIERSEQMVEAMEENGGTVKFTVYPEGGHDAWTEAYADPRLYLWLLRQKRGADPAVENPPR